ncbi:zinc finger, CCHC-type, retrotransposon gag domain protein [Tanacetum coccineum]
MTFSTSPSGFGSFYNYGIRAQAPTYGEPPRTDARTRCVVQAAVDAMLPQIREQVREEYRTGASGSNPPSVTIHTWLERFNKQKPHSFDKGSSPYWLCKVQRVTVGLVEGLSAAKEEMLGPYIAGSLKELFFLQFFPRAEQERLKREYHSIRQRASENSTEYMQRFLRLAGFFRHAAGTAEEQAKNFRWGLLSQSLTIVERSTRAKEVETVITLTVSRVVTGVTVRVMTDRKMTVKGLKGRAVVVTTVTTITTTTLVTTTRILVLDATKRTEVHVSRSIIESGSQQSRVPFEGYTHPVCNTCGRRHPGECRRAAGTCFKCGQAGHLQRDCKKNTGASSSGKDFIRNL